MVRIGIQLYSLRSLDEPTPRLVRRVGDTAFEGVEFAGLGDAAATEVTEALTETGLTPAAGHVGLETLESAIDETRTRYALVGCETLVVPRLEATHFEDDAAVRAAAGRLNDLAGALAEWDVDLCYHNHGHEFAAIDDGLAFDVLVASLDARVGIELDVGWVAAAGHDPVAVLDRLDDRLRLVHLKDVDSDGRPVEPGEGVVDLPGCTEAAVTAGADWLLYEHDDPADPLRSLASGAAALAELRDAFGR